MVKNVSEIELHPIIRGVVEILLGGVLKKMLRMNMLISKNANVLIYKSNVLF